MSGGGKEGEPKSNNGIGVIGAKKQDMLINET